MTSSIISTTYSEATSRTHSPLQTIFLHLLPGGAVFIFFVMLARLATQNSLPASLALLVTWAAAGIPIELGIMFYHGWQQNGRLSLNGVVFNRERIPLRQYAWLVLLLLVWTATWSTILIPENETLRQTFFAWWPDWLILSEFARNLDQYLSPVLWMVVLLSAVMNLAVPMVEELYFRGFLLPRIPSGQQLAPLINAVLFFGLPFLAVLGNSNAHFSAAAGGLCGSMETKFVYQRSGPRFAEHARDYRTDGSRDGSRSVDWQKGER